MISDVNPETLSTLTDDGQFKETLFAANVCSVIAAPLVSRGRPLGALTLLRIMSRRRYSKRNMTLVMELARRASIAIDNAHLYEAGQQANAAKSEFVANMSHEIRTPMTAVLGYTELLLEEEQEPEKLKFLSMIRRNGEFLLEIINDILDLSKIEAGKFEIVREPFAIHRLVNEVHAMMLGRSAEKNLDFTVEFAGPIPTLINSDEK